MSSNNISPKDRFFGLLEVVIQCLKYQGFTRTIVITYHYLNSKFFGKFISGQVYNFLGFSIKFTDLNLITNMFYEIFGQNIYYFKSDSKSPTIIDIGANIGDSLIYFKWLHPKSKIYAFEPLPNAYALLQKNVSLNNFKDVYAYNVGLGNESGSIRLYSDSHGTSGDSTTSKETTDLKSNIKNDSYLIKIRKLSSYKEIMNLKSIDVIKIDIEGAEGYLLDDLRKVLPKTKRVFMEYHVIPDLSKNSFDKFIKLFKEFNFNLTYSGFYRNSSNDGNHFAFLLFANKPK